MKDFEQYAAFIEYNTNMYDKELREAADKVSTIITDWRLSDKGKNERRQKVLNRLDSIGANFTKVTKEAVYRFLQDFRIKVPSDGKDHKADIDNALRVIQMLGRNLDERNIKNFLEPLRGDFRSMKYVLDVLDQTQAKKNGFFEGRNFRIADYLGITDEMLNFIDYYDTIARTADNMRGYGYHIGSVEAWRPVDPNNPESRLELTYKSSSISFSPDLPYELYILPELIRKTGKLFNELEGSFSSMTVNQMESDTDILKSLAIH